MNVVHQQSANAAPWMRTRHKKMVYVAVRLNIGVTHNLALVFNDERLDRL